MSIVLKREPSTGCASIKRKDPLQIVGGDFAAESLFFKKKNNLPLKNHIESSTVFRSHVTKIMCQLCAVV